MLITPSDAVANNLLTSILDDAIAGSAVSTPYLRFYTGAKPAKPDVAVGAQVLLGTCNTTAGLGSVAARALTAGTITQDSSADADGTATWARLFNRNNVAVLDFDVSNTTGSAFLKMNTTVIVAGGPILVNSLVITA